jgi:hypothetical protein
MTPLAYSPRDVTRVCVCGIAFVPARATPLSRWRFLVPTTRTCTSVQVTNCSSVIEYEVFFQQTQVESVDAL